MNGPIWLAAWNFAAFGCMSLGEVGPSRLPPRHPRIVAGAILSAIGALGFAIDVIRVLTART